jgi:hypothetical protein
MDRLLHGLWWIWAVGIHLVALWALLRPGLRF